MPDGEKHFQAGQVILRDTSIDPIDGGNWIAERPYTLHLKAFQRARFGHVTKGEPPQIEPGFVCAGFAVNLPDEDAAIRPFVFNSRTFNVPMKVMERNTDWYNGELVMSPNEQTLIKEVVEYWKKIGNLDSEKSVTVADLLKKR